MIQRAPEYYTAGHKGEDPSQAPLYLRALVFDGAEGEFNTSLINKFNQIIQKDGDLSKCNLKHEVKEINQWPEKIIVINASHDNLPTSYETARIFEDYCKSKNKNIPAKVVNDRAELLSEIGDSSNILIMSQCVDKNVYNIDLAEDLDSRGLVIVPGKVTAPGSVFSDKNSTYELLSDHHKHFSSVAKFIKVDVENKTVGDVTSGIFKAVEALEKDTGDSTFFIKPHEGGGGLGGFRITKRDDKYIIPDLSKVSGDVSEVHPTFIDFDFNNEEKLKELLWIYRLFASDEKMTSNYILIDLPIEGATDEEALKILKSYLQETLEKREHKLTSLMLGEDEAKKKITKAIKMFEKKFDRRYVPLVNEHLDFGLWGLRAHYRLTRKGPKLETIYSRIFQLAFTPEGVGYLGSDNISNKQTGDLEILRLGPIREVMVESIGGEKDLFGALRKGAEALVMLSDLVQEEEKGYVPLRVQLDLAAPSKRIGEGNADTARGLCLASRWTEFVNNAQRWLEDSLVYYSWKKRKE